MFRKGYLVIRQKDSLWALVRETERKWDGNGCLRMQGTGVLGPRGPFQLYIPTVGLQSPSEAVLCSFCASCDSVSRWTCPSPKPLWPFFIRVFVGFELVVSVHFLVESSVGRKYFGSELLRSQSFQIFKDTVHHNTSSPPNVYSLNMPCSPP